MVAPRFSEFDKKLKVLFKNWLVKEGNVQPDDILVIELDESTWLKCRNPLELEKTADAGSPLTSASFTRTRRAHAGTP